MRLFPPYVGAGIYHHAKAAGAGAGGSATVRGEEMMQGRERRVLEEVVWGEGDLEGGQEGVEAELEAGDGMFVPLGWWHSIKGVGEGVTASVNWWFR